MHLVRVFDQLIHNVDRNLGNLVIDKEWRIWMIDHGRAFRMLTGLKTPENLVRCDRRLLERLKSLDAETLRKEIGGWVRPLEIKGLLARRDKIVAHFDKAGDAAMYDYLARQQ
jgi:hypothetical protein